MGYGSPEIASYGLASEPRNGLQIEKDAFAAVLAGESARH
jgi:hypothetical protein